MTDSGDRGSLAMLDESGTVVSWYGRHDGDDLLNDKVVGRHVAQFYVPEDVALGLPHVDLSNAKLHRNSAQAGWRRRADGGVFWAMTFIEAVLHRNGALQGFSHVIRRSSGPWGAVYGGKATSASLQCDEPLGARIKTQTVSKGTY